MMFMSRQSIISREINQRSCKEHRCSTYKEQVHKMTPAKGNIFLKESKLQMTQPKQFKLN